MSAKKWIVALVLLALLALFVPFVPQTQGSGQFYGANYHATADVSPSYYFFHCGSVINSQISAQLASGISGVYQLSKGYTFSCDFSSG